MTLIIVSNLIFHPSPWASPARAGGNRLLACRIVTRGENKIKETRMKKGDRTHFGMGSATFMMTSSFLFGAAAAVAFYLPHNVKLYSTVTSNLLSL